MARSIFYYHLKRLNSSNKYAEEKNMIESIFHEHKGRYDYWRITTEMQNRGFTINHKTVWRLVDTMELKNKIRKIRYRSYKGAILPISPNIINRNFIAQAPNRKWATDVTQINIGSEKLHLSLILDMFNGKIIFLTYPEVPFLSKYTICLTRRLLSSTILTD